MYPNPATETVTFRWTENYPHLQLEVYLVNGAKVLEQEAFSGKAVPVSHLGKGVYIYKMLNGTETLSTGKLVKE